MLYCWHSKKEPFIKKTITFLFCFAILSFSITTAQAYERSEQFFKQSCNDWKEDKLGFQKHIDGLRHIHYVYEEVAYRCNHEVLKKSATLIEETVEAFEYTTAACGTGDQELFLQYLDKAGDDYFLENATHELSEEVYLAKDETSASMESEILQYYDLSFYEFDAFYMLKPENIDCNMIVED